jgi:hypothetical protein
MGERLLGLFIGVFAGACLSFTYMGGEKVSADNDYFTNEVECVKSTSSPCDDKWMTVYIQNKE